MRRREDGERHTSKSTGRSKRVESSCAGDGGPAVLKKTEGQVYEYLCHTSMHVRNGNLGSDRTTTQAASVRKQLGPKNSKSNESRHAKNGGVKGMLHWRKYTTFTLLCINSIIYLEAICP